MRVRIGRVSDARRWRGCATHLDWVAQRRPASEPPPPPRAHVCRAPRARSFTVLLLTSAYTANLATVLITDAAPTAPYAR